MDRRLNQACQPSVTPSSPSSPDSRMTRADLVEGSAAIFMNAEKIVSSDSSSGSLPGKAPDIS